jgi:hypothetical protein
MRRLLVARIIHEEVAVGGLRRGSQDRIARALGIGATTAWHDYHAIIKGATGNAAE